MVILADWNPENRNEAQQILASKTSFEFIVVFMTTYRHLALQAGITVKLQRATVDIVEAHCMITEVTERKGKIVAQTFSVFTIKSF